MAPIFGFHAMPRRGIGRNQRESKGIGRSEGRGKAEGRGQKAEGGKGGSRKSPSSLNSLDSFFFCSFCCFWRGWIRSGLMSSHHHIHAMGDSRWGGGGWRTVSGWFLTSLYSLRWEGCLSTVSCGSGWRDTILPDERGCTPRACLSPHGGSVTLHFDGVASRISATLRSEI